MREYLVDTIIDEKFQEEFNQGQLDCVVCLEKIIIEKGQQSGAKRILKNMSQEIVRMSCTQKQPKYYHYGCLYNWLLQKANCPLCREYVNQENHIYKALQEGQVNHYQKEQEVNQIELSVQLERRNRQILLGHQRVISSNIPLTDVNNDLTTIQNHALEQADFEKPNNTNA
ncbi:UNKNOWN [Stylonychia lemnae]|uniref:RING-type domain-containing protein n=1 Tax=Stylonychia lemnae TaxID=5949 RepID=A0A078A3B1_STYLE|nr:UNKNOWN [Stylonychia lemnae]|eukprot:CDW76307.1 UNKNOWN [Stylonychia lemnae]